MYTIAKGTLLSKETIKNAIKTNENDKAKFNRLYNLYIGQHDEILKRKKLEGLKNEKLIINHAQYITDLYVGYLFGTAIDYTSSEEGADKAIEALKDVYKKQTIPNVDTEVATDSSIYGKSFEYVYVNEASDIKSRKIDPRNCIIAYDDSMDHNKVFAVMYSDADLSKDKYKDVIVVTTSEIIPYDEDLANPKPVRHTFGVVPMIEYHNNSLLQGDFEQVETLINAYNLLQSDRINDVEQLVEAILVTYGYKLTPEQTQLLKEWRIISAPSKQEGADTAYVTKQSQESQFDILRSKIEADIFKISKTPNMSDENFVGNASGVAIKFKILPFEWNSTKKERSHEVGLRERFTLYNKYLNQKDKQIPIVESYKVDIVFSRSLPNNDFETSQMINNLDGKVSDETLVSQLSFVKDANAEVEKVKEEKKENMTEFAGSFGTNQPNDGSNPTDNSMMSDTKDAQDNAKKKSKLLTK